MTDLLTSPEMLFPIIALWVFCQQAIGWRSASPAPDHMPAFALRGAAAVPAERLATDERALKRAAAARPPRTAHRTSAVTGERCAVREGPGGGQTVQQTKKK